MSPTKAGRENGIKQGTVSMWKKRGSLPNADVLVKLANFFNTTPAYLLGEAPDEISKRIDESQLGYDTFRNISDYISKNPTIATDSAVGEIINDVEFQGLIKNLIQSLLVANEDKRDWLIQIMSDCLKINKKHNLTDEQVQDLSSVIDHIDTAISTNDSELFVLVSNWIKDSLSELRQDVKYNHEDSELDATQEEED
jgi:transcriptional regulator with XRE-family HTH domain